MAHTIIVVDDGEDFNMYPQTALLTVAAFATLMLCLFKAFGIGVFATVGWWITIVPFALCGAVFCLIMLKP